MDKQSSDNNATPAVNGAVKQGHNVTSNKYKDLSKFAVSGAELWDMSIDSIPHLVENLIPANGISLLGGTGGIGKSSYTLQLAIAIATGKTTFLGKPLLTSSKNVIYVATEDGRIAASQRLRQMTPNSNAGLENITFIYEFDNILPKLESCCIQLKPSLVVLDCLADLIGGEVDFNSSGKVREILTSLSIICDKYNTAILFIHHLTKNSDKSSPKKNNIIGSVAFTDKVRLALQMDRDEHTGLIEVAIIKSNYLPHEITNQLLVYKPNGLVFTETDILKYKSSSLSKPSRSDIEAEVLKTKNDQPSLSARAISEILKKEGIDVGKTKVAEILKQVGDLSVQNISEKSDGQAA